MSNHRFKVGSIVSLQVDRGSSPQRDRYVVEAQMPPVGTRLQYRIKSEGEGFRRVVVEDQLASFERQHTDTAQPARSPLRGEED